MTPKKEVPTVKRLRDYTEEEQRRMLDTRVTARNIKHGILQTEELEGSIASLPDLASQAVPVGIPCPSLGGRDSHQEVR